MKRASLGLATGMFALAASVAATTPPTTSQRNAAMDLMRQVDLPSGKKLPYYATHALNETHPGIEQVLIIIPGGENNGPTYFTAGLDAARAANRLDTTAVITLQFQTEDENPRRGELYWTGDWQQGANSLDPSHTSTFTVLDNVLKLARSNFPDARSIVLAGHSSGGQVINRYVALGGAIADDPKMTFIVMNPSTFVYLDARRPQFDGSFAVPADAAERCPDFDTWKYGLNGLPPYAAGLTKEKIRANIFNRNVVYLAGGFDDQPGGGVDDRCQAEYEGHVRRERAQNYWRYLQTFPGWNGNSRFAVAPGIGHSGGDMIRSEAFSKAVFGRAAPR